MNSLNSSFEDKSFVFSQGSELKTVKNFIGFYLRSSITVNTPSALSFATTDVNTTLETITEVNHGYLTGLVGQFTTTTTLPAGISLATNYFIIKVDADTYKIATSLANARIATAVNITDVGTGTHTFTPTALAGGEIKLQASAKLNPTVDADWEDIADSAVAVTVTTTKGYNVSGARYHRMRYYITVTAGQLDLITEFNAKG